MNLSAIFIISFDCEGKWGMCDLDQSAYNFITNDRLNDVYKSLVELLRFYQIKGTFAFVGAFTMTVSEFLSKRDWFSDVIINENSWLKSFKEKIDLGDFEGWLNPKALEIILAEGAHEIAGHSFTHLPVQNKNNFLSEMHNMQKSLKLKGIIPKTFVYPRNQVVYAKLLKEFGILGYRDDLFKDYSKYIKKVKSLLNEFNIFEKAQKHSYRKDVVNIPSGYFLNWRAHIRKKIPVEISIKRWKHLIKDAINNKKVLHLWTHPHNFINGDNQILLLKNILKMVKEASDVNKLKIMTQQEYINYISCD
ncbi:polysaccharide deacetylase family protein [bacterium]